MEETIENLSLERDMWRDVAQDCLKSKTVSPDVVSKRIRVRALEETRVAGRYREPELRELEGYHRYNAHPMIYEAWADVKNREYPTSLLPLDVVVDDDDRVRIMMPDIMKIYIERERRVVCIVRSSTPSDVRFASEGVLLLRFKR